MQENAKTRHMDLLHAVFNSFSIAIGFVIWSKLILTKYIYNFDEIANEFKMGHINYPKLTCMKWLINVEVR